MRILLCIVIFIVFYIILKGMMKVVFKREGTDKNENETNYTLRHPHALKQIYLFSAFFCFILFCFFLVLYLKETENVTIGHLNTFIVMTLIGAGIAFWSSNWWLRVQGESITFHRLFKKTMKFNVNEITRVRIGEKGELNIYVRGKKLSMNSLLENIVRLENTLVKYGKLTKSEKNVANQNYEEMAKTAKSNLNIYDEAKNEESVEKDELSNDKK